MLEGKQALSADLTAWTAEQVVSWADLAGLSSSLQQQVAAWASSRRQSRGFGAAAQEELLADSQRCLDAGLSAELLHALEQLRTQAAEAGRHGQGLYVSTAGVRVGKRFQLEAQGQQVQVRLLDFAGQTEYYLAHQAFLGSPLAIYVLVCNLCQHPLQKQQNVRHLPSSSSSSSNSSSRFLRVQRNPEVLQQVLYWLRQMALATSAQPNLQLLVALTWADKMADGEVETLRRALEAQVMSLFPTWFARESGEEEEEEKDSASAATTTTAAADAAVTTAATTTAPVELEAQTDRPTTRVLAVSPGQGQALLARVVEIAKRTQAQVYVPKVYLDLQKELERLEEDLLRSKDGTPICTVAEVRRHCLRALNSNSSSSSRRQAARFSILAGPSSRLDVAERVELVDRALQFLHNISSLLIVPRRQVLQESHAADGGQRKLRGSDLVVLNPLVWMAQLVGCFVSDVGHVEGQQLRHVQGEPGVFEERDMLQFRGFFELRRALTQEQLDQVLIVFQSLQMCWPVGSAGRGTRRFLFPCNLPFSRVVRSLQDQWWAPCLASPALRLSLLLEGPALSSDSLQTGQSFFPPFLFALLQTRLGRDDVDGDGGGGALSTRRVLLRCNDLLAYEVGTGSVSAASQSSSGSVLVLRQDARFRWLDLHWLASPAVESSAFSEQQQLHSYVQQLLTHLQAALAPLSSSARLRLSGACPACMIHVGSLSQAAPRPQSSSLDRAQQLGSSTRDDPNENETEVDVYAQYLQYRSSSPAGQEAAAASSSEAKMPGATTSASAATASSSEACSRSLCMYCFEPLWGKVLDRRGQVQVAAAAARSELQPRDWEPNREDCFYCGKVFLGLVVRRHHCRFCGHCVCSSCAPARKSAPRRCLFCAQEGPSESKDQKQRELDGAADAGALAQLLYDEDGGDRRPSPLREISRTELHFFRPEKVLGKGAFGKVLLAEWRGVQVAVKQPHPQQDAEKRQQLFAEFEAEATLNQQLGFGDQVVPFFGICKSDEDTDGKTPPAIVLGRKDCSLSKRLAVPRPRMSVRQRLQILCDAAHGLLHMHNQNVLHRDVRADNILVDEVDHGFVSDFGLSLQLRRASPAFTVRRGEKIPFAWMPPEVLAERRFSRAADVWMFGALMWEVITEGNLHSTTMRAIRRQQPVPQLGSTNMGILARMLKAGFTLLQHATNVEALVAEGWPRAVFELLHRCWALTPASRPPMQQVLASLQKCSDELKELQPQQQQQQQQQGEQQQQPEHQGAVQTASAAIKSVRQSEAKLEAGPTSEHKVGGADLRANDVKQLHELETKQTHGEGQVQQASLKSDDQDGEGGGGSGAPVSNLDDVPSDSDSSDPGAEEDANPASKYSEHTRTLDDSPPRAETAAAAASPQASNYTKKKGDPASSSASDETPADSNSTAASIVEPEGADFGLTLDNVPSDSDTEEDAGEENHQASQYTKEVSLLPCFLILLPVSSCTLGCFLFCFVPAVIGYLSKAIDDEEQEQAHTADLAWRLLVQQKQPL